MWEFINGTFSTIEANIGFITILVIIYIISMFLFWYESRYNKKNTNSVFDQWFFSSVIMLVWGRATYIISNWDSFAIWNWFWLPYERYGEQIYVFRAMPWRLFRIWDGGFLFIPMYVAFIFAGYLFVVHVKKWRWREMYTSVFFSANFLLGSTLFVYGLYTDDKSISLNGIFVLGLVLFSQIMINILKRVYRYNKKAYDRVILLFLSIFTLLNTWFISYTFLSEDLSNIEKYNIYFFIVLSIYLFVIFILDVRNPDKRKSRSTSGIPSVTLNQAIKPSDEPA